MWRQKGQDMIEYALMLALVVGIGGFIYTQGYGDNISAVFNNAGSLLEQVNKRQEEAEKEAEKQRPEKQTGIMRITWETC